MLIVKAMRANQAARALAGDSSEAVRKGSVAGRFETGVHSVINELKCYLF